jgi:cysteinyl-tRNA synthetase
MSIYIYNSLTKKKEIFMPLEEGIVKMYVCGQTVYDYCHLGHARKAIVFDMIRRWFISSGFKVIFIENITDIEDKIIKKALECNKPISEVTEKYTKYMQEDFAKLGILPPDFAPQATNYVAHMLKMISKLLKEDYAYLAENGDIYYKVRKFTPYGKLSGKDIDSLRVGERVAVDPYKSDPLDFVLWKAVKDNNEPAWDSEFGRGRPGWHIECSAMALEILGKTFDIHAGGQDLQFPHHENEIAQSEAYNQCKFANYWLHNGFLNINDEKMSKSLGNFLTLREVLEEHDAELIRFFVLKTHYRSPLNFNYKDLEEAKNGLSRLYTAIKKYEVTIDNNENYEENEWSSKFKLAMNDDFNTPLAISILFELVAEINKKQDLNLVKILIFLGRSIGLLMRNALDFFQNSNNLTITIKEIENLIEQRKIAKLKKDFSTSDQIRNTLLREGIILEDNPNGTLWRLR